MFKSTSSYSGNQTDRQESPSQLCMRSHTVEMIFPLTHHNGPLQHRWKHWSIPHCDVLHQRKESSDAAIILPVITYSIVASETAYTCMNKKETFSFTNTLQYSEFILFEVANLALKLVKEKALVPLRICCLVQWPVFWKNVFLSLNYTFMTFLPL